MTTTAIFSIGTNLGDRSANLQRAVDLLGRQLSITAISPVSTEPWGDPDQPHFLNICVAADTDVQPTDLLVLIKSIESEMGRVPTRRWGPRLIDLDLILYGDDLVTEPNLIVPHPSMNERAFVLVRWRKSCLVSFIRRQGRALRNYLMPLTWEESTRWASFQYSSLRAQTYPVLPASRKQPARRSYGARGLMSWGFLT